MSCWVIPTIAAEFWGVSVDQILQRVRDGDLPHRVDEGFMFIDVVPPPPPTFTVLSESELEALRENEPRDDAPRSIEPDAEVGPSHHDDEADETQSPDDDEASVELGDWRATRQRVARTRIPPGRAA